MENSEIVIRLDPQLTQAISRFAWQMGISESELVRRAVIEFLEQTDQPSLWELGRGLFGKYSSGQGNLAVNRKPIFQKRVKAKQ
ncbi:MAG TPA: CopG family transcriptional regulator [Anaerolineae bacterium]|nr:CopG family transcriptional regulator [Anaerolineae bacterium]HIP71109.1 CopG family transcriptional regulator [Anaerolineae bacterium]